MGECFQAIFGVILPPVAVLVEKGCGGDFWINLLLTIFTLWIGGILHAFHVFGINYCANLLCVLLPPVGVLVELGCGVEFWISLVLTLLGGLPGVIYSYYALLVKTSK